MSAEIDSEGEVAELQRRRLLPIEISAFILASVVSGLFFLCWLIVGKIEYFSKFDWFSGSGALKSTLILFEIATLATWGIIIFIVLDRDNCYFGYLDGDTKLGKYNRNVLYVHGIVLPAIAFCLVFVPEVIGASSWEWAIGGTVVGAVVGAESMHGALHGEGLWLGRALDRCREFCGVGSPSKWRRTKTFLGFVGEVVVYAGGAVVWVIVPNLIYYWATGKSVNWLPLSALVAGLGALGGLGDVVSKRIGKSAVAGEHRLVSYVREALPAILAPPILVLFLMIIVFLIYDIAALSVPTDASVPILILFVLGFGFFVGIVIAFLTICSHAYKRGEFLSLAVTGTIVQGTLVGGSLLFPAVNIWLKWQNGAGLPWGSARRVIVVGAVLGVAFELWRRFAKPRGWSTTVTIGRVIKLLGGATSRGKKVVIGLWFAALGFVLLWVSVPPLMTAAFSNQGAQLADFLWPGLGAAVGAYWFCARGLEPIWNAITGPPKLTKDDLALGQGDLAAEDKAARAARGGRQ